MRGEGVLGGLSIDVYKLLGELFMRVKGVLEGKGILGELFIGAYSEGCPSTYTNYSESCS